MFATFILFHFFLSLSQDPPGSAIHSYNIMLLFHYKLCLMNLATNSFFFFYSFFPFLFDFPGGHHGDKSHSVEGHCSIFSHRFQMQLGIPYQL